MTLEKFVPDQGDTIRKAGANHAPMTIRELVMGAGIYAPTIVSMATKMVRIFATDARRMVTPRVTPVIAG
jgi:hypothetical protein